MGFKSMNPRTPIFPLQWSFSKSCFSATIFIEIDTVCVDGTFTIYKKKILIILFNLFHLFDKLRWSQQIGWLQMYGFP